MMSVDTFPYAEAAAQPLWLRRCKAMLTTRTIFAAVLGLLLVVLVFPPLLFLLQGSLSTASPTGELVFSLDSFRGIVAEHGIFRSISNSFLFAVCSALLAVAFGGVVAWITERTNAPFARLAYVTTVTSLGTPYILYISAWLMLIGRSGPLNVYYRQLTGATHPLINAYSMASMVFIEGLLWSPMVFLLISATLRNFNPELEEAAKMCGANGRQIFKRITLKLSMPSVLALIMLVFIRSLEAFEVPAVVGIPGQIRMLTTDIYETLQAIPPDLGSASALSACLLAIVAILLYVYSRMTRNAEQFATVTGKNFKPNKVDLGRWRYLAGAVVLGNFIMLSVLPLAVLVWASLLPFYQAPSPTAFTLLTLNNYINVFKSSHYVDLIGNTLIIAAVSATVVMLLTSLVAWLRARKAAGSTFLDSLATMPLAFPGVILGVAVMQLFLNVPVGVYGTIWIIVWAFVINTLPYGIRYSYAGMLQLHKELEEAALMSGARPLVGFARIVLPLLSPSLFAGWVFIFLLATRVLSLPVLLSGPSSQTMAVAMFDLMSNGQTPELAALGLLWSASMTAIVVAFHFVARKSGVGIHGH
ncbi:MAG TPA: iron ABC transporter permease [Herbaspirillum sp.]|jgi:iron(III) transport system permease protein